MGKGVVVVIEYKALSGKADEALRELSALVAEVVDKEPDCLGIQIHQGADDDTRILLYERWTSKEAYTGPHMQTPYIQAFIGRGSGFLAGPPAITFWQLMS